MTDPNDLAYPKVVSSPARDRNHGPYTDTRSTGGLTKRELFAAMAMQGLLANPDQAMVAMDEDHVAFSAMQHADALIAELNKETP